MFSLILTVIIGILFAIIAVQNTEGVSFQLLTLSFVNIPLYLILLGALLSGLIVAGFISAIDSLAAFFTLRKKDNTIDSAQSEIGALHQRVYNLELENARLRGQHVEPVAEPTEEHEPERDHRPRLSFFDRLRHSF